MKKAPPPKASVKKATKKVAPTPVAIEVEDEVVYPEVTAVLYQGDLALTCDQAKEIIGWVEDSKESPHGKDYLLKDHAGVKIRCTNNVNNRIFSMGDALDISQEILRKKWRLNGESMIVGDKGTTLSAQHRLTGFILACQEYNNDPSKYAEFWDSEPTLECLIVCGISEKDDVVNTIDTGRPRSLMDVIYRSEFFADLTLKERKESAKACQFAVTMLWERTGVEDALSLSKTHAESLEFINNHPRLLECVNLIREDNENGQITHFITPGNAAGLLYLMGCSKTNPKGYYETSHRDESQLDWDLWDTACDFWIALASGSKDANTTVLRAAFRNLIPEDGGTVSKSERLAVLIKAWNIIAAGGKLNERALALKWGHDEDGTRQLLEFPTVGGIDVGTGKDIPEIVQTQ